MTNPKTVHIKMMIDAMRADFLEDVLIAGLADKQFDGDVVPEAEHFIEQLIAKLQHCRHQLADTQANLSGTGFDLFAIAEEAPATS